MTPEEIGADIFKKSKSPYVTKEQVLAWLDYAKKRVADEVEYGFYQAEMKDQIEGGCGGVGSCGK